jgi:hypothetical protein
VWSAFERFLKGFFGLARLEFAYQHGICVCVGECRFVPKIKLRERVCVGTFSVREPFKNWGVIPQRRDIVGTQTLVCVLAIWIRAAMENVFKSM